MSQQMNRSLRGDPFWGVIQEGGPLQAKEKTEAWQNICIGYVLLVVAPY